MVFIMSHFINENDKSYKPFKKLLDETEPYIVDKEALNQVRYIVFKNKEGPADPIDTDPDWVDY